MHVAFSFLLLHAMAAYMECIDTLHALGNYCFFFFCEKLAVKFSSNLKKFLLLSLFIALAILTPRQ